MAKIMRFLLSHLLKCSRGGILFVKKLSSSEGKQKIWSGAPWGPMREAANGEKLAKMSKIHSKFENFYLRENNLPNYLCRYFQLVQ